MRIEYYLDRLGLIYITTCFSTAGTLLLLSRPQAKQLGQYNWLAYWLFNSILLFNAWLYVNAGNRRKAWVRKLVAAIVLPAALLVADFLFPVLLEVGKPVATIITPLFLALGFVASATGFIGTRGNPTNQSTHADVTQAKNILKDSPKVLLAIGTAVVGSVAIEPVRTAYVRILGDAYLLSASVFILGGLVFTLVILPFIVVNSTTPPADPGPASGAQIR